MNLDNFATWLEINLGVLEKNYKILKSFTGKPVMPVIKANAYGHGLEEVGKTLEKSGASWCGVARIEEALMLRNAGIRMKILILGYTPPLRIPDAIKNNISLTLYDPDVANAYAQQARMIDSKLNVQVKIDTGMGRLGYPVDRAFEFIQFVRNKPEFNLEAVFTHFACADEPDKEYTHQQLDKFKIIVRELESQGMRPHIIHAANSAATLNFPESHYDMVRCGLVVYGLSPSPAILLPDGINPVLSWKTRLISIKELPANHGVSYGFAYFTKRSERIGVIAAGYADGLRRRPGNHVLINGKYVPVIGNVCMDQCMVQLNDVPDVKVENEVVLIGKQGENAISAADLAKEWGTISYEVVCGMAARMPREYII